MLPRSPPRAHLRTARAYAERFPDEIESLLEENRRPLGELRQLYPFRYTAPTPGAMTIYRLLVRAPLTWVCPPRRTFFLALRFALAFCFGQPVTAILVL